jgi:peptidyl-prolyl cis-trans isomerase C
MRCRIGCYWTMLTAAIALPAYAQNIAVVNGMPIPSARASALLDELMRQGQQDTPALRAAVRDELISREVLMQEAARRSIPNQPEIKAQLAIAQQNVVIRALVQDFLQRNSPSEAEIRARYEAMIKQIGNQEYRLRHILVADQALAKRLIAKLSRGARFETLARQYSKDPGSARRGGDLGWAPPQNYVSGFATAALQLKKGLTTANPVHTQFGWHIIRLDAVRDIKAPTLDAVKSQLAQQLQQEKLHRYENTLREKAKIR